MERNYTIKSEGGLIPGMEPKDIITRFEKVNTSIMPSEGIAAQYVADKIIRDVNARRKRSETFVLGLTTGKSPIGIYKNLLTAYREGRVSFSNVVVFSLDEFYPISPQEQQSRNWSIHDELLAHVDIPRENVFIPDGTLPVEDISEYCRTYDNLIKELGGIDLMLLGTGPQGQVGFNEPGSYFNSRTRLVALGNETLKVVAPKFFGIEHTPRRAITMGLATIFSAKKVILIAWGEDKASAISKIVEGDETVAVPASCLQSHPDFEVVVDEGAADLLTRVNTPWLVGTCSWSQKFIRKAVIWLCNQTSKPILKLTHQDYIDNSLLQLLEHQGSFDQINIKVFNDLQHTITGWPGGKPNADDSTRPERSMPYPKRVVIFSPHPDDDVISMGGTFLRLADQGHDVHVAYQTSGNIAVHDDVVLQMMDMARECGLESNYDEIRNVILNKRKGEPEPESLRRLKGAIRRSEAKAACRQFGLDDETHVHFLNLPFYETGGIKKGTLSDADIDIVAGFLRSIQPHQIYAAGDLSDPHGTHRVCIEAVLGALKVVEADPWVDDCRVWLYRGAWQEWDLDMVDMAVPLSPDEVIKKRHAIYRHLSQKDIVPFPGEDKREFWQRAEERTQHTAYLYDKLGMAEYQAIEVFVRLK